MVVPAFTPSVCKAPVYVVAEYTTVSRGCSLLRRSLQPCGLSSPLLIASHPCRAYYTKQGQSKTLDALDSLDVTASNVGSLNSALLATAIVYLVRWAGHCWYHWCWVCNK